MAVVGGGAATQLVKHLRGQKGSNAWADENAREAQASMPLSAAA